MDTGKWSDTEFFKDNDKFEELVMECVDAGLVSWSLADVDKNLGLSRSSMSIGDVLGSYTQMAMAVSGYVANGKTSREFYDDYISADDAFENVTLPMARGISALYLLTLMGADGNSDLTTVIFRSRLSNLAGVDDKIGKQIAEMLTVMDLTYELIDDESKDEVARRAETLVEFTRELLDDALENSPVIGVVEEESVNKLLTELANSVSNLESEVGKSRPNLIIAGCLYLILISVNRGVILPMALTKVRIVLSGEYNNGGLSGISNDSMDFLKSIGGMMDG